MTGPQGKLAALEAAIRDLINQPRRQAILLRNRGKWYKLCSSLDVIGDTEIALDGYLSAPEPGDDRLRYILVYGALQSLMVQQDAVSTLTEALQLTWEKDDELAEIREVRNYAVGHPTKRGKGEGNGFSFITRISMTKEKFTLTTFFKQKAEAMHREASVPDLIFRQRDRLGIALARIRDQLEQEEKDHKRKFEGRTVRARFPQSLEYHLSKLSRFDPEKPDWSLLKVNFSFLDKSLNDFREELTERDLADGLPGVQHVLDELDYAWGQMRDYLEDPHESRLCRRDMEVFASFVRTRFLELATMAEQIDQMYSIEE